MDLQMEKLELIEWLTQLKDASAIREIKALKKKTEIDWWDDLSTKEKVDIEEGLMDLKSGRKKDIRKVLSKHK
jgi:hypothetical protein